MITKKKTLPSKRKNKMPKIRTISEFDYFLGIALSVWEKAMTLPPEQALSKKKESFGWALLTAKKAAEREIDEGKLLSDCLRTAARILLDEAEDLEYGREPA